MLVVLTSFVALLQGVTAERPAAEPPMFDVSKEKVLYCVGYAHLDTQWRWDFCTTIDRFVKDTLVENFDRFEKHPGYVFNFTGSVRYEMMEEYYPELFAKLKEHVAAGRWKVSGSSVDEGDVNVPSAEAVIRQVLYGNQYFRREFGKESQDFMLPDCFGFPASMPSIWAHCGLKGFSTQKLTWGSAVGIPFKIGVWEGLDGAGILAALDPGPYVGAIKGAVHENKDWARRIEENGTKYGVFADYHYYGVGDTGGAPRAEDIANYLKSVNTPDAPFKVALVSSDQLWKDITPTQRDKLPRYRGDLLLTEHSAGTLTSQSYMKRWNRKNEQLADAAERAAVAAHWLGAAEYPREKLYKSWVRALANQMHDILPGTSIPRAYRYSWNDELLALNGFAEVLTDSVGAVSRMMDTRGEGKSLLVYNPLAQARRDVVEALLEYEGEAPPSVRVYDGKGYLTSSQVLERDGKRLKILFVVNADPVSFNVYDVRPADADEMNSALKVSETQLENSRYRVTLDANGDVASIVDLGARGRELLAAPHQLQFTYEKPANWPAWNMDWADRKNPPIDVVRGPAKVRVVESGPVRVALEVERTARNSIVRQQIRLSAGSDIVEFDTFIDWQATECALKAAFPLTVSNPLATYNWGMGTIERGNNEPTKYEVPSHEWMDLTASDGSYGVSILEDSKFGSDKPTDNVLRQTLLYTPGVRKSYLDQHSQDWGRHDMVYAVYGHARDWRDGGTEWQARRLNQPLRAFNVPRHEGALGRNFCFLRINTEQVDVRAVKLAEDSERVVVRLQELFGRDARGVEVSIGEGCHSVQETDGQERPISGIVSTMKVNAELAPYSPLTFAASLLPPAGFGARAVSAAVNLPFNADVVSADGNRADGAFDAEGRTIPAEMLPETVKAEGVEFVLGRGGPGAKNALECAGQEIALPSGDWTSVHLLAAATEDVEATLRLGDQVRPLRVQSWTGFIGQWDDRIFEREFAEIDHVCAGKVVELRPGFIKRDPVAWFCTHRHHPAKGNESYQFSYLYRYSFELPANTRTLTLPDDRRIKLMALSVAKNASFVRPAAPLYDDFSERGPVALRHVYPQPPKPLFDGVAARGNVATERRPVTRESGADYAFNFGFPLRDDYADQNVKNGVTFKIFDGGGKYKPNVRSGAANGEFFRLNDGVVAQNDDDTANCIWYDNEGRFFADLQRDLNVQQINTFSWHRSNRAPQYFSLWGAGGEQMPDPGFTNAKDCGWTLLGVVDSRELGTGGIHGSAVHGENGAPLGTYRWLLWIAEDVGEGTFFTEIDIHAAP